MSLTISAAQIVEESDSPLLAAPESWPRNRLGDVATILNGFAFKSKQFVPDGGMPLIRIRDIRNTSTVVGYIGDYQERYVVRKGELLVGMDGDFNCARWAGPDALLNQRVCKITPDAELLDLDYLTAVLPGYLQAIHAYTSSTTVTHLSSRDVADIPLPLPPVADQQTFAAMSDSASASAGSAALHLASACRAIERFRQAVLTAACSGRLTVDWREQHPNVGPVEGLIAEARTRRQDELGMRYSEPTDNEHALDGEIPDSWSTAPLGLLLASIKYGTSVRSEYNVKGIAVLRIPNVSEGRLNLTDLKFAALSEREAQNLSLASGDILMIRSNGSPQLVGRSVLIGTQAEGMAYAGYLMRLRSDASVIDPAYLAIALSTADIRHQIEMPLRSTSGVNNINTTEVRSLRITLPPLDEQVEIVRKVDQLMKFGEQLTRRIAAASHRVDRTSQAVLAKAFRGDLVRTADAEAGK